MVDILFLAHKRPEFTRASLKALLAAGIRGFPHERLWIYTDGDTNLPEGHEFAFALETARYGGPVACMNDFLDISGSSIVAKIDSDTIVPPGWLPACLDLMHRYPNVDLLGIEPWTPDQKLFPTWKEPQDAQFPAPFTRVPQSPLAPGEDSHGRPLWRNPAVESYREFQPRPVSHIGGIGVFRRSAFERFGRPVPNSADGRYGFTEWQWSAIDRTYSGSFGTPMVKAFIDPPLPVFLLDHLPFEPWRSLSRRYETEGVQRNVGWEYDQVRHAALWGWAFASGGVLSAEGQGVGGSE